MKISSSVAFSTLNKIRHDRAFAAQGFKVLSLNKDGSVSKARCMTFAKDEAEAQEKVAYLEKINPGRKFTFVPNN